MESKVDAKDLKVGMFVADLDRPWIDTPFLLQGFLIEDDQQIRQLQRHCQFVIIDRARSVGEEFTAAPKNSPVARAALPRNVAESLRMTRVGGKPVPVEPPAQARAPASSPRANRDTVTDLGRRNAGSPARSTGHRSRKSASLAAACWAGSWTVFAAS